MGFREYRPTEEAISQAIRIGVTGDVEAELIRMAKLSTPYYGRGINRRFEKFVFLIEDGFILHVSRDEYRPKYHVRPRKGDRRANHPSDCVVCGGQGMVVFWDEHEECGGRGCSHPYCKDGEVKTSRACPGV